VNEKPVLDGNENIFDNLKNIDIKKYVSIDAN
jgi:hypothetical protein